MQMRVRPLVGAAIASFVLTDPALAASNRDAQFEALQQQVRALLQQQQEQQARAQQQQEQMRALESQVQSLTAQLKGGAPVAAANPAAGQTSPAAQPQPGPAQAQSTPTQTAQSLAAPVQPAPKLTMSKTNRPMFVSADGQNAIGLSSIFNFDAGAYSYRPRSAATPVQGLQNGVNARRARIGLNGVFMSDWAYDLQYDFGNFDDALTDSGAPKSGVKSAYISYKGIRNAVIELGYLSVPFTIDQATANTDYMFMEHPIPQALAIAVTGGDSRSALGAKLFNDRGWIGGYLTGPKSGTSHTTGEQVGGTLRGTYQIVQNDKASLHVGGNLAELFKSAGNRSINLAVQPEISIDPTAAYGLSLGNAIYPLEKADVYGVELAGGYDSLFFQGEYFYMTFDRKGLPETAFNGGYLQASWTLTGEQRKYNRESGAYGRIYPDHPMSLSNGGYGAWEVAARISTMDMTDHFSAGRQNTAAAVDGGASRVYALGVNWYPNNNLMFRLNYLHGGFGNLFSNPTAKPSLQRDTGADFDAVAMRAQLAF
ncbi:MAG: hypothetical protein F8N37_16070 [Telmatospirillum sp.]|nr:hypothetical protein [Telmatospirillum sp.]